MALNPLYITAPNMQRYFVDKDTGLPLAGGKLFFYRDSSRTELKPVYELQGNQANYSYKELPNPVILSGVGTIQDDTFNDIIEYYYPYDAEGNVDLYYVVCQSATGVPQWTRQAWPNPNNGSSPASSDNLFNYIPNGQMLAHVDISADTDPPYLLPAGSTVLAQGGFTFELPNPLPGPTQSVTTAQFLVEGFTDIPPQSPRYVLEITCTTINTLDSIKNLRIKFADVNKFSTKPGYYTFAFWATSNVSIPIAINTVKYFGTSGSPTISLTQSLATITTEENLTLYQFTLNFGTNAGKLVDTVANNDYVAIDIALPTNIGFQAKFTDFVLTDGEVNILNFPVQTNADMMARGVFGWADQINPDGSQLYLPPVLTPYGMTWDASQIGEIEMSVFPIPSPNSTSPIPNDNRMPCDGATYISAEHSSNGIPYSRLATYLRVNNPNNITMPLYGTGANYVSGMVPNSGVDDTTVRIVYNAAGTGSPLASDGGTPTNITFSPMYLYSGSSTGGTPTGLFSSNYGPSRVSLISSSGFTLTAFSAPSPFVAVSLNSVNELRAFQSSSCIVVLPAATSLTGGTGKYWQFTVNSTQYYVWYNLGGQTNPSPGGIPIQINLDVTYSSQDVADVTREALNIFNATQLTMPSGAPGSGSGAINAGSYFYFSANPASITNFYVWFSVDNVGSDPNISGKTSINVPLLSSDTPNTVRDKIRLAINSYQFQAPDFRGMFFRCADPNMTWDTDAAYRWSYVTGFTGPVPGTYEYQQFLNHNHGIAYLGGNSSGTGAQWCVFNTPNTTAATNYSGGNETRPVNTYIYPFIRY